MKSTLKTENGFSLISLVPDLKSGFVLSLIALPLSVGIALASGAPASAGLLAAIVGGILGAWLGSAQLTINGPAAGLIVVVLGAVESLGQGDLALGFRYALAAMIAAGALQIIMGGLRLANLGLAFPSAVIHGMLAAIGAIIIAKQIPVMLGAKAASSSVFGLFLGIPEEIRNLNPEVALIGLSSILVLFVFPRFLPKKIPMPLLVVCLGIALGKVFDLEHQHTVQFLTWKSEVSPRFLLNVPNNIRDAFIFPDFSRFFTWANVVAVVSISAIGTIESVLSTFAVDKLDPLKRTSDLNRDLVSKGICNCVLGFIGGLPIISEIVRSSANIENGAQSKKSNFFHGVFILLFLALFPNVLHAIPLACLASILIFVGWRLAHPSQFQHAAHIGIDHIAAFLVTFIATLATDLLVGVALGVVTEIILAAVQGVDLRSFFSLHFHEHTDGESSNVVIKSPILFTNSLKLRKVLQGHLKNATSVSLDLTSCSYIDHTVLDQIERMQPYFQTQGLHLKLRFDEHHQPISKHPLASRRRRVV